MGLLDQIILLLTGLTAVYLIYRLYQDYNQRKPEATYNFYYIVSFAVLFVSGVLLILAGWGMFIETDNGWDLLQAPFVAVVATLIPLCLSVGLMYEFNKRSAKGYFIFAIIALVLVIFTRTEFCEKEVVKIIVYAGTHAIAGLLIFFNKICE